MTWRVPPRLVLVPVDFGDASARALAVGGVVAHAFSAELIGLHAEVLEAPPYFTHEQMNALEAERQKARASAVDYLRKYVAARTAHPVSPRFVEEPPAEAILRAGGAADLVVMGTHGRRGPSHWWLGSVAERVVAASETPVMIVRAAPGAGDPAGVFGDVLTLVHRDADVAVARAWADALASAFGGTVCDGGAAEACPRDAVNRASLVVVAVPAEVDPVSGRRVASLLRNCDRPLLFVPATRADGGHR